MITKLNLFDFDGTLFDSPSNTEENQKKYQKATGIPWVIDKEMSRRLSKEHDRHIGMRRGWWGRPETLEPPLVANPAPKEWFKKEPCDAFLASKKLSQDDDPTAITLLLTGRYTELKNHVLRILDQGKLVTVAREYDLKKSNIRYTMMDEAVAFFCLGEKGLSKVVDNGPMPSETFPWKMWILGQYAKHYPEIKAIEVWEDREEHVKSFGDQLGGMFEEVIINHVV